MNVEIIVITKDELTKMIRQEIAKFQNDKQRPDVMTVPQICEYLAVTKPTIYSRIKTGLPVSYALGEKSPRFIKDDIDRWLRENK